MSPLQAARRPADVLEAHSTALVELAQRSVDQAIAVADEEEDQDAGHDVGRQGRRGLAQLGAAPCLSLEVLDEGRHPTPGLKSRANSLSAAATGASRFSVDTLSAIVFITPTQAAPGSSATVSSVRAIATR